MRFAAAGEGRAVRYIEEAAFGQPDEANLVSALVRDGDAIFSLVAEVDGKLLGHALFSALAVIFEDRIERALALAPVAVLPEHQRQGIGSALIRDGLGRAAATGWSAAFVLGDPAYYTRFGFSVEAAAPLESPYAGPHFMASELRAGALVGESGRVVYPQAFETG
ncbi:MAG: GNAT family N-acetyltransferase [Alphaproteobacteria bacterium]|nr:GNAT family N-acetyltransferase [Alphaproteobacteria bacterium]